MTPRATYRIQFHKDFGFDAAARLAPYLRRLGVSHLYASPYLKAHPGSTHGYDIVDYEVLNPELGGRPAFDRLAAALDAEGLRHILDFVPNHMGVGGADNAVWLDLLEWGPEADHAGWFDVDWDTDRPDLRGKLLVPFLGDQYGAALEAGHLRLKFDAQDGSFAVWAHDTHKLPVCPLHYDLILGRDHPALERLGDGFSYLMRWKPQVMRRARELKDELRRLVLEQAAASDAVNDAVARLNGTAGDGPSWDRLHALIERQNWRASHFLVAGDDINYRRFFNIATLAGLRMELPDVFDHAHRLVFGLMEEGLLDGLRIDHVDGLFDPKAYLDGLRRAMPRARDGGRPYLVVEKILGRGESLRADWPVDGTTGYDFTNLLTGLFVDRGAEEAFTAIYARFTGRHPSFDDTVLASKLQIIDNEMSSELHRLARSAVRVARQNPRTADFTDTVLRRAIRLIVAFFPVYRTYIDDEGAPTPEDLGNLDTAVAAARAHDRTIDPSAFAFLRGVLSGDCVSRPRSAYQRSAVFRCAMKLQQYCGPVMAKGVEDTAFYRYYRFVALNEVGGAPDHFGTSVAEFHDANQVRAERWPDAMLATSTHDTKRGEDTRARLAALSGMPEAWDAAVTRWSTLLRDPRAPGPDRNDEYLIYQLLVGTVPPEILGGAADAALLDGYADRLKSVLTKSIREAKVHSTWVAPDAAYEDATLALVDRALRGPDAARFLPTLCDVAATVAERGAAVTFAQTVLKFTVPGMPDIYQGSELWDLSMVDPDNRRPIDYDAREAALAEVTAQLADDPAGTLAALMRDWRTGCFKLALTTVLLHLRADRPDLFRAGSYAAVATPDPLCAFVRSGGGASILVVAARRPGTPVGDAALTLPDHLHGRPARNVLTGAAVRLDPMMNAADLLGGLPGAVLLA